MSLEGRTYSVKFEPNGNIPPGAIITEISWSWSYMNLRSDTEVFIGPVSGTIDISNFGSRTTDAFAGENPNQSIYIFFRVPGTGTINPEMIGLRNMVTVNWTDSFPQPTEITGPSEVEVAQTIELNGAVNYATTYSWTTAGDCSLPDLTNAATATIRGDRNGFCRVTRVACNNQNQCTTDTHGINVTGQLVLTPVLYLLLSK
jgi:hypothetical protein